jgi:hypothetical protein
MFEALSVSIGTLTVSVGTLAGLEADGLHRCPLSLYGLTISFGTLTVSDGTLAGLEAPSVPLPVSMGSQYLSEH